ncbi:MAG: hypothetical protein R6U96_10325 [Promethearchaeia archaeon]
MYKQLDYYKTRSNFMGMKLRSEKKNFILLTRLFLIPLMISVGIIPHMSESGVSYQINSNNNYRTNNAITPENEGYKLQENEVLSENETTDIKEDEAITGDLPPLSRNVSRRRIFFDMSHEQLFSVWDTGYMGYSELNILLQRYFLEVSTITDGLLNHIDTFTENDTLFLNVVKWGSYAEEELDAIEEFVKRGGNLIILGEHNVFNISEFQNPLLEKFDMELTTDDIFNSDDYVLDESDWPIFESHYFNLNNLSMMAVAELNTYNDAFSIANVSYENESATVMGGYEEPDGGKVFCATDTEWLWNLNSSYPGINYGNNSKLFLNVLDWFYNITLSEEVEEGLEIEPEYTLFTAAQNDTFPLNLSLSNEYNVTAQIEGGEVDPLFKENASGKTTWNVSVESDGYIQFFFNKTSLNGTFSVLVYFFEKDGGLEEKVLFLQNNYSRAINPSPDGLLAFAYQMHTHGFNVQAAHKMLNYSEFSNIIIANPLEEYSPKTIELLNHSSENGTRLIFFNVPYSSFEIEDYMSGFLEEYSLKRNVPINNISSSYGIDFVRYIVCDSDNNKNNKIYFPKLIGANSSFYNLSSYMTAIINTTSDFTKELGGYPSTSWGDHRTIFGTSGNMGENETYFTELNCTLGYTSKILGAGILNYFINTYFDDSHYFNDFFYYWMRTGEFNKKYELRSNVSEFNFKDIEFELSYDELRNVTGDQIPNGTLFTVITTKGEVKVEDQAPNIPGTQIKVHNGGIKVPINNGKDQGLFEIAIYNSSVHKVILSYSVNFSSKPHLYDIESPNYGGTVNLMWESHNGAKTYYVLRATDEITKENYTHPSVSVLGNTSTSSYTDSSDFAQGETYYYAIIASNYSKNSTISNNVYTQIRYIPIAPYFESTSMRFDPENILSWENILYAISYKIYLSTKTGFNVSEKDNIKIYEVMTNEFSLSNLSQGNYYLRVKSIGEYGNSSLSEELTLEIRKEIKPDDFTTIFLFIITSLSISTIVIISYFWLFLRKPSDYEKKKFNEKEKQGKRMNEQTN